MNVRKHSEETPEERVIRVSEEYLWLLRKVARECGVAADDVEDVVHDVLLIVLCYLRVGGTFGDTPSKERAWLCTAARNASQMFYRKLNSDRKRGERKAECDREPIDNDPLGTQAVRKEEHEALRRAIESLPPKYRMAIEACDIDGLTVAEVARRSGIPYGTARMYRNRGQQMLTEKVKTYSLNPL